jgi:hypothetical protein
VPTLFFGFSACSGSVFSRRFSGDFDLLSEPAENLTLPGKFFFDFFRLVAMGAFLHSNAPTATSLFKTV